MSATSETTTTLGTSSSSNDTTTSADPPDSSEGLPEPSPLEQAARAEFTALTERGLPGALVGVHIADTPVLRLALGVADVESKAPMQLDMYMRTGSVAKLMVGHAALQLVASGSLDPDDTVDQYVPGVPNGTEISMRMLANHTAGLFNSIQDPFFRSQLNANPQLELTTTDLLDHAFSFPSAPPGQAFAYSNTNTIMLAEMARASAGLSLTELLESEVFSRYGTPSTGIPEDYRLPDPSPHGYRFGAQEGVVEYGDVFFDATDFGTSWTGAAGNLYSTLDDLLTLAKPLASGAGLPDEVRAELDQWVSDPADPSFRYSFCLQDFDGAVGHGGDVPGFSSFVAYAPSTDASVVVLTNLSNFADEWPSPAEQLGRRLLQAIEDDPPSP